MPNPSCQLKHVDPFYFWVESGLTFLTQIIIGSGYGIAKPFWWIWQSDPNWLIAVTHQPHLWTAPGIMSLYWAFSLDWVRVNILHLIYTLVEPCIYYQLPVLLKPHPPPAAAPHCWVRTQEPLLCLPRFLCLLGMPSTSPWGQDDSNHLKWISSFK